MLALHNSNVWADLLELSNGAFNRALEAAMTKHGEKGDCNEPLIIKFTIPVSNPLVRFIHAKLEIPSELVRKLRTLKNMKWYSTTVVEPEKDGVYFVELEGMWDVAHYSVKSFSQSDKNVRPVRFALPRLPID